MTETTAPRAARLGIGSLVAVWLALLALLAATYGLAHVPLGAGNLFVGLGIAAVKVLLVGLVFMGLDNSVPLIRLAAVAALLWVGLLFTLTFADVLIRY